MDYANIEYAEKLGWLFPKPEYWGNWYKSDKLWSLRYESFKKNKKSIPMITVEMAFEVLPVTVEHHGSLWCLEITRFKKNEYSVHYSLNMEIFKDEFLSNALCKMIEYLIKENLINKK